MKHTWKKLSAWLLTAVMLLTMMPMSISAAGAANAITGKVIVNGIDLVNDDDDHTIDCGDGKAVYDPATQTLTLTNAEITTDAGGQAYAYSGIYAAGFTGELKIVLVGTNRITLTDQSKQNTGIMIPGATLGNFDLAISGTGSLAMELYDANVPYGIFYAGLGDLSISGVAIAISLTEASTAENDAAIRSNNDIIISNAAITAEDFWTGLSSGSGDISIIESTIEISAFGQAIYTEGEIEIEDSIVSVYSKNYGAITGWSDVNITESVIEAKSLYSNGIYVYGHLAISGGEVEASSEEWNAICAIGGMTVSGDAEVTAEGECVGIYTNDTLTVESGRVKAIGREDIAILAQRISGNAQDSKPADSPVAIVLGNGMVEASGAAIATDDWVYTEVWDDWDWCNYDKWMSQSYFVDTDSNVLTEANITSVYTVEYKAGENGTGDEVSAIKIPGTALVLKEAIFTRTGYTQTGWATIDGGAKVYDLGALYTNEADMVLYPYWTANQYTITFDANGGSAVAAITQDYGTAVTAPTAPTKADYTFAGWSPALPATMPAENLTLVAQWTAIPENIVAPSAGGSVVVDKPTPAEGDTVTITPVPESGMQVDTVTAADASGKPVAVVDNGDGSYSFVQPEGIVTISVTFKAIPRETATLWLPVLARLYMTSNPITAIAGEGGSISDEGVTQVKYGRNHSYVITPDEGYVIADVLVNGKSVGAVSEYTFKKVRRPQVIEVVFAPVAVEEAPVEDSADPMYSYEDIT